MTQIIEFKNLRGLLDKTNSDKGIVFVHGFERTTIERKFKAMVDELKNKVNLFRFDFSACGLSDGSFEDFSVKKSTEELKLAVNVFIKKSDIKELILVGHSLGGCIILDYLKNNPDNLVCKILFFAPALNQKNLLRYYFVKGSKKDIDITWQNYQNFLDEEKFLQDAKKGTRMTKEHWLGNSYFLENLDQDYNNDLKKISQRIFVDHGDRDDKVPIKSNSIKPNIVVSGGDHDLQRPDMIEQWLPQVIKFLN